MKTRIRHYGIKEAETLTGFYENPDLFAGNIGTKDNPVGVELLDMTEFDKKYFGHIDLKPEEQLFRLTSDKMRITDIRPIVKINLERGLIYYLEDYEAEQNDVKFETRGTKATYLNIVHRDIDNINE